MTILLTGGSGCGKSSFAEQLCQRLGAPRYYLAAMRPYGAEADARIARHRAMRAQRGFVTVERYVALSSLRLPQRGVALLECLCNLTANELFDPDGAGAQAEEAIVRGVEAVAAQCAHLVVVTNDVGSDGGGYDAMTTRYIEVLGRINRRIAARADTAAELVCGIPVPLKGVLP